MSQMERELFEAAGQYLNIIKGGEIDRAVVENMEDLFHRKMWHQLTVVINDAIKSGTLKGDTLITFYESVVKAIETKLNPLQVVQIAVSTSKQQPDHATALTFLQAVLQRIEDTGMRRKEMEKVSDSEAGIYVKMRIAWHRLETDDMDGCKTLLDEAKALLDVLAEVDSVISSAYYWTSAQYFKKKQASGEFYKASLRYLTFTPLEDVDELQRVELARDLCIAALITDNIFTFGELLMHPVMDSLTGTENEWMVKMIRCLNYGHITEFESLCTSEAAAISAHPIVFNSKQLLKQKVAIASVLELIFHRKADERLISFQDIAEAAVVPVKEVELLLIKAMSLGLVKGRIDEVEQSVAITWALPHALDLDQIAVIKDNIGDWKEKTKTTMTLVEDHTRELLED